MRPRLILISAVTLFGLVAVACTSSAREPLATAAVSTSEPLSATATTTTLATPAPQEPAPTATPESTTPPTTPSTATTGSEPTVAPPRTVAGDHECDLVQGGPAPAGVTPIEVEVVADGLEVPWGLAFLPNGDLLVTERPGRVRLVADGVLVPEPVLTIDVSIPPPLFGVDTLGSEGGLLGVLLHPDFTANRQFYLFHNAQKAGAEISRVDRFVLAADGRSAEFERNIIDDLPAGVHHQGGRMHVGPDGMLYVGVGAWEPELAQDPDDLSGKLLRVDLDGGVPPDNPDPASPVYVSGIRNAQGFDWFDAEHIVMTDHGPSGFELDMPELRGFDEINVARAGDNLGWPLAWGCDRAEGTIHPTVTFETSVPPTGATFYRGDLFPEWTGSFFVTTVGGAPPRSNGRHLQRIEFAPGDPYTVVARETYLRGDGTGDHGRLRTVVEAPDGSIYVMTSNCDNRGVCPPERDRILRLSPG